MKKLWKHKAVSLALTLAMVAALVPAQAFAEDTIATTEVSMMKPLTIDNDTAPEASEQAPPKDAEQAPPKGVEQAPPKDAEQAPPKETVETTETESAGVLSSAVVMSYSAGDFAIEEEDGYSYENGVLTISDAGTYNISMASAVETSDCIEISATGEVVLNLTDINIDATSTAIKTTAGYNVTNSLEINLKGTNVIKSNENGILADNSSLTVQGEGSLELTSVKNGISSTNGSMTFNNEGDITIVTTGSTVENIGIGDTGNGPSIEFKGSGKISITTADSTDICHGIQGNEIKINENANIVIQTGESEVYATGILGDLYMSGGYLKIDSYMESIVGNIVIEGGEVDATATAESRSALSTSMSTESISISGAKVTALAKGDGSSAIDSDSTLTIKDGATVFATAEGADGEWWYAHAICGEDEIIIENATITATATGDDCDAISSDGSISITDSTITATANSKDGNCYAIYAGENISISGSKVEATATVTEGGLDTAYAIFADESVSISDSEVYATVDDGYGYAICANSNSISIANDAYVEAAATGSYGWLIYAKNDIEISNSEVLAYDTGKFEVGMYAENIINISYSKVDVTVGGESKDDAYAICSGYGIDIDNSVVNATANGNVASETSSGASYEIHALATYYGGDITINESEVNASATLVATEIDANDNVDVKAIYADEADITITDSIITANATSNIVEENENIWVCGIFASVYENDIEEYDGGVLSVSDSEVVAVGMVSGEYELNITDSEVTATDTMQCALGGGMALNIDNSKVTANGLYYGIFVEGLMAISNNSAVYATSTAEEGMSGFTPAAIMIYQGFEVDETSFVQATGDTVSIISGNFEYEEGIRIPEGVSVLAQLDGEGGYIEAAEVDEYAIYVLSSVITMDESQDGDEDPTFYSIYLVSDGEILANDVQIGTEPTESSSSSSTKYYTITVTVTGNGAVSPDGDEDSKELVKKFSNIEFEFEPDDGYVVGQILVDGKEVDIDDEYEFENVIQSHTLEVVFVSADDVDDADDEEDDDDSEATLTLNKEDHFAYVSGYPDESFAPDANITRAETVVIFSRLLSETMDANQRYSSTFWDVTEDDWYANQVGYMEQFGIVSGYEDGSFGGSQSITRAEFAAMASRFDSLDSTDENIFTDVSDGYWAADYINSAASKGWISGYVDNTFKPQQYITRAEAITLVNNVLERSCDLQFVLDNYSDMLFFFDVPATHWAYTQIIEATNGHEYEKDGDEEVWTELH